VIGEALLGGTVEGTDVDRVAGGVAAAALSTGVTPSFVGATGCAADGTCVVEACEDPFVASREVGDINADPSEETRSLGVDG
jgi:hypothetical protein